MFFLQGKESYICFLPLQFVVTCCGFALGADQYTAERDFETGLFTELWSTGSLLEMLFPWRDWCVHGWDGSKAVPAGSQAHLEEIVPLGKEEKQGQWTQSFPILQCTAAHRDGQPWRSQTGLEPHFLHLPVCGSDLTSQRCKQHHTSTEQSLTSLSIKAMSYQAKKPPIVPRTYTKRGDHLTNPHISPTGGWLLLSKQSALILLSQNHQPLPLTQQNRPKQGRQPPAAQHFWVENGRIFPTCDFLCWCQEYLGGCATPGKHWISASPASIHLEQKPAVPWERLCLLSMQQPLTQPRKERLDCNLQLQRYTKGGHSQLYTLGKLHLTGKIIARFGLCLFFQSPQKLSYY